ncbi:MAG: DUF2312 domain-containing protein [Parvibaculaceae bacterium]
MAKKDDQTTGDKVAGIGHNSVAGNQLKSIVERIEKLNEEKKAIGDDIRDIYAEAKANGFETKIIRKVIAARKQDATEREEEQALFETYCHALGVFA